MDAGGGGRALWVAGDAGRQDLAVLEVQAGRREVVLRAVDVQVRAGGVAQRGDHARELRTAAVLIQLRVEALVERDVVRGARAFPHLLQQRLERGRPLVLEARGGLRGGQQLQRRADLVVLAQVVDAREED